MAIYRRKDDAAQKYSSYKWKAPLVFASFVAITVVCIHFESFWQQEYPQLPDIPSFIYPIGLIGAIFCFGLMFAVPYALQNMMTLQIELTSEGISRSGGPREYLFLPWEEITGYTEGKQGGILVCTADPVRRILIPSDVERYSELRGELAIMGITEVSTEGSDRSWVWAAALVSIFIVLLVFIESGQRYVYGNVFVATTSLTLVGLIYRATRNRPIKDKPWRLLTTVLLLASAVALVLARNSSPGSQRFYSEIFYLSAITVCVAPIFRWGYTKWLQKKRT
jgi:hypothetical protein